MVDSCRRRGWYGSARYIPERIKAHPGDCPAGRHGIRYRVRDIKKGIEVLRVERDRIDPIGNALWYDSVAEGIDAHAGLILYPYP